MQFEVRRLLFLVERGEECRRRLAVVVQVADRITYLKACIFQRAHEARANGYVLEHILVAEEMLGRPLTASEEVHHKNRDKLDNRPENLQIYPTHKEHWMTEHYEDVARARDAANSKKSTKDLGLA